MTKRRRWWHRLRSAVTGRFIGRYEFKATDKAATTDERVERKDRNPGGG